MQNRQVSFVANLIVWVGFLAVLGDVFILSDALIAEPVSLEEIPSFLYGEFAKFHTLFQGMRLRLLF